MWVGVLWVYEIRLCWVERVEETCGVEYMFFNEVLGQHSEWCSIHSLHSLYMNVHHKISHSVYVNLS